MAYTTGMSKEGKKLFNSKKDISTEEFNKLISPEDKKILDENIRKDTERMMKKISKNLQKYET